MEMARFVEEGFRVTEQDRVASEAKDNIGQAPVGDHVQDLGSRTMAVAADADRRGGPALTQVWQETGQNHRSLRACGACPGPEGRCDSRMRRALKDQEGQRAITLGVMVLAGAFLLAMRAVIGVLEVKHDGRGGLGGAGKKVVHEGRGETREVLTVHLVSSRENVGALAKSCVASKGSRSTPNLNMGSCRRLLASLPSA